MPQSSITAGRDPLLLRNFWIYSEVIVVKIKREIYFILFLSLKEKGKSAGFIILPIHAAG